MAVSQHAINSTESVRIDCFFFQAEDGIRDYKVTGVQTCALPISYATPRAELGSCATAALDSQRQGAVCAGLDFRYNLASDLALVGTVNPDFGQVEADQRVLNLSTFETFFPEKRPFFLEGLDLFKPALQVDMGGPYGGQTYQIFYSRRIGRATPSLDLDDDQTLIYQRS